MNAYDQMRHAMSEAETQLRAADAVADELAKMLRGRLRRVSNYHLRALKRELREFNIQTGKWNS